MLGGGGVALQVKDFLRRSFVKINHPNFPLWAWTRQLVPGLEGFGAFPLGIPIGLTQSQEDSILLNRPPRSLW